MLAHKRLVVAAVALQLMLAVCLVQSSRRALENPYKRQLNGPNCGHFSQASRRSWGDRKVSPGQWPSAVHFFGGGGSMCGGTLVNSRQVVTAAHCVKGQDPNGISVFTGVTRVPTDREPMRVAKICVHKNFSSDKYFADMAILLLTDDVISNKEVQSACLYTDVIINDNSTYYLGFPKEPDGVLTQLKSFDVPCEGAGNSDTTPKLCATADEFAKICKADPGSGVYKVSSKQYLYGIHSTLKSDCKSTSKKSSEFATSIAHFAQDINSLASSCH